LVLYPSQTRTAHVTLVLVLEAKEWTEGREVNRPPYTGDRLSKYPKPVKTPSYPIKNGLTPTVVISGSHFRASQCTAPLNGVVSIHFSVVV
jgi:hypothetical protein